MCLVFCGDYIIPYIGSVLFFYFGFLGVRSLSSLLNMVIEQVEHCSTDAVILRFNPWLCSDPKQLITQFFKQLASAIKIKKPAADTMCELVDQYADLFDAASLIPYAGTAIAAAGKVFANKARNRMNRKSNDMQGQKDEIIRTMVKVYLRIKRSNPQY